MNMTVARPHASTGEVHRSAAAARKLARRSTVANNRLRFIGSLFIVFLWM
jgi:hypothetical protein